MHVARKAHRAPVSLERITVPKPQHVLAEQLRGSILRGEIPEGNALPTEKVLISQTGLSRGAVREALRTLAVEGLVRTRNGRFGGSVAMLPGNDSMASAVGRFVQGRKLPLRTLQEMREVLEPFIARLAAERRSSDDLRNLTALHADLVASVEHFQAFATANVKWHNAVAKAGGNELLAAVLYSISAGVLIATSEQEYGSTETRRQVVEIHAQVNDAIEARDADRAERSMRAHILAAVARPAAAGGVKRP